MKSSKKSVTAEEVEIFNTEVIYSQVMCLHSIGRIELEEVLKYELSPVPLSLFDSNREMRHSTSKADLKNRLQIKTSQRLQSKADVVIIVGCGIKGATREQRMGNLANNHVLSVDASLPSREIVMTSSQNKIKMIDIISKYIVDMLAANNWDGKGDEWLIYVMIWMGGGGGWGVAGYGFQYFSIFDSVFVLLFVVLS